jgi:hypothetical protein
MWRRQSVFVRAECCGMLRICPALRFFTRLCWLELGGELARCVEYGALDQLVSMNVTLAVELGPSGRGLIRTTADADAGLAFVKAVATGLPSGRLMRFRSEVLAEYYAMCAYLYGKQGRILLATRNLAQSWRAGPRHRGNRGLVRALIGATRS